MLSFHTSMYDDMAMEASKLDMSRYKTFLSKALSKQIEALKTLEYNLDSKLDEAIELLQATQGKIVVCGMGKSGFIARKFSATLSSTGSPSVFMHPSEALHGDLGILSANDVLVLLSNSGNTEEIKFIIDYCHLKGISVIGISRNPNSTLSKKSDISIVLHNAPELAEVGAPTTSSTMMLVMCDLIALTLMEIKQFCKIEYKKLHPGGSIGTNLLTLKDVMHKDTELPLIKEDQNLAAAILEITQKRLGCVGVISASDKLVGIITDGDLRRHIDCNIHETSVRDIMTTSPICFQHSEYIVDAIAKLNEKKRTNAFVLDGTELVGIVHIHDLLSKLIGTALDNS